MSRSTAQWKEILASLSPQEAAKRIFGDLICYRHTSWEATDADELANALDAWREIGLDAQAEHDQEYSYDLPDGNSTTR